MALKDRRGTYGMNWWKEVIGSLIKGLKLTFRHLRSARKKRSHDGIAKNNYFDRKEGIVTVQYPKETIPVPEVGRYQLHVEIDDCIVCDLCAKICPVDCIDIISIKATEDIGMTSDGTKKKLYAARFDIDMAKCMFCGLCTVVCPTECIIMTDEYDKSVDKMPDMIYKFAEMSPEEIEEKKTLLEKQLAERQAAKQAAMGGLSSEKKEE